MRKLRDLQLPPALIAAAANREPSACANLYGEVSGATYALVRRMVGSHAADDVFQDTMLAMFAALAKFRADGSFGLWLRRIAVNRCLMHLRSPWQRSRVRLATEGVNDPASSPFEGGCRWQQCGRLYRC